MQRELHRQCDAVKSATNATELLYHHAWESLLDLYAVTVGIGKNVFSDYDRFLAMCEMMPLMQGHEERARCESILLDIFGIDIPLCPQNCSEIWRRVADALLTCPRTPVGDSAYVPSEREKITFDLPRVSFPSALSVDVFQARTLDAWQREIVDEIGERECFSKGVRVELPRDFRFCNPDPYHVGIALARRAKGDDDVLLAQLVRVLCVALQKDEHPLYLIVNCDAGEAIALLSAMEKTVGLPTVYWMCDEGGMNLLDFSIKAHKNALFPVLCRADDVDESAFYETVKQYAQKYPLSLISIVGHSRFTKEETP